MNLTPGSVSWRAPGVSSKSFPEAPGQQVASNHLSKPISDCIGAPPGNVRPGCRSVLAKSSRGKNPCGTDRQIGLPPVPSPRPSQSPELAGASMAVQTAGIQSARRHIEVSSRASMHQQYVKRRPECPRPDVQRIAIPLQYGADQHRVPRSSSRRGARRRGGKVVCNGDAPVPIPASQAANNTGGGGSFTTSQKSPSCLITWRKESNSTGFWM